MKSCQQALYNAWPLFLKPWTALAALSVCLLGELPHSCLLCLMSSLSPIFAWCMQSIVFTVFLWRDCWAKWWIFQSVENSNLVLGAMNFSLNRKIWCLELKSFLSSSCHLFILIGVRFMLLWFSWFSLFFHCLFKTSFFEKVDSGSFCFIAA